MPGCFPSHGPFWGDEGKKKSEASLEILMGIQRKHKPRMLQLAKRRLGIWRGRKGVVFDAVARDLGVDWDGTKEHGYDLVYRFVAIHKGQPMPGGVVHVPVPAVARVDFLQSYEWRALRMRVLTKRGAICECCGSTPKDGIRINVDHIKPRKLFPELALDEANLQVLCDVCNHGKGNWDQTDWRADPMRPRLVRKETA